jgi:hypothetical protein
MTSLKLFYKRGAPAALLLGLIVGAPDIAQAEQLWSYFQPPPRTSPATDDNAIVKVAEDCGIGNFRDEYGHCRHYGFGAPPAPPGEACPPDRHFVHWVNHSGGRCIPNY